MDCIKIKDGLHYIETKNTCYAFIEKYGFCEHIYYGKKIRIEDIPSLYDKNNSLLVNTLYPNQDITYCIDGKKFEFSTSLSGDSRSSSLCILNEKSNFDFVYKNTIKVKGLENKKLPIPKKFDDCICVECVDKINNGLILKLWYLAYYESDVIVRFSELVNNTNENIKILKFDSMQLDIENTSKQLVSFTGAWGREMNKKSQNLVAGKYTFGSFSGLSSAECNPLFFIADKYANQNSGNVYGFNLIYSGSHEYSVEVDAYDSLRIMNGIQSENLSYILEKNRTFMTPCSVITFSDSGFNQASINFHDFCNNHIIDKKEIPIMLNTWEAMYFDINENKLANVANKAKECGIECLVIDDGWFLGRNDDTTSLGDWIEDLSKFSLGIKVYSDYIRDLGLSLGIWIEPEMISEASNLYKEHSDWVLCDNRLRKIVGRGQYILDLTNIAVQDYIFSSISRLVKEYGANYIKWDFNRRFREIRGNVGSGYFYDYITALYSILGRIKKEYSTLIIENCASGGGRFDLGMLYFTSLGWVSDNTNPLSRSNIQESASYGYPISVMLNHIASEVGHQTKRTSDINTRINTAFLGRLGVQANLLDFSEEEIDKIKKCIFEYKEFRKYIYDSKLYRLSVDNYHIEQVISNDKTIGYLYIMREKFDTVTKLPIIYPRGLDMSAMYRISGENVDIKASGETLMRGGVVLPQNYQGVDSIYKGLNLVDSTAILLKIEKE